MHLTHIDLSKRFSMTVLVFAITMLLLPAAEAQDIEVQRDIAYGTVGGMELALDIYMPANVDSPPLVVFVHGGAWRNGNKDRAPMQFPENGFAMASLDFRQSGDAQFPAMIHDIKGAIRFLRSHAGDYGYSPEKFAITGESSGGHLAALVGVTNGHAELEGNVGGHENVSSDIQAIISYYGASDLTTILAQSPSVGLRIRPPALEALLGALPEDAPEIAQLASPVYHVDANDPPLLLFHGDRDPQMPINQAHQLDGEYANLGLDVHFDVVHGSAHGGSGFYDEDHLPPAIEFLNRTIGN
jgi:acetyl esterase/lipase